MRPWRLLLVALAVALPTAVANVAVPLDADAPAASPASGRAVADASYRLAFECPEAAPGAGVPVSCPTYVLDREDILGSPRLVVDPVRPELVAFSALHGGRGLHAVPGSEPPTGRSRDDAVHQPHTTFATRDGGRVWEDMPYHAPDSLRSPSRDVYGDDHAIALDEEGRLHLAALYSYRQSAGPFTPPGPFQNAVAVWKAHPIDRPVDYHVNLRLLEPATPDSRIDSIHLLHAPDARAVVLVWREVAPDGAGAVVVHWSRTDDGALWTRADPAMGPCEAITNPLALDGRLVMGCRRNATGGWRTYAIDTATWSASALGEAPMDTPHALLVHRAREFVILVGSGLAEDGAATVQVAYGEGGERWSAGEELAGDLTRASPSGLLDARVTAAAYAPLSGNLHLVYLERHDLGPGGEGDAGRPEFTKLFVSLQAEGSLQTTLDLGVGTVNRAAFAPTLTGVGNGAYDDIHDGLVVWTDPASGRTREFLAFGDYGFVRFAEVVEENFLSPIAPLAAQVPPVPAATAGGVPALVGIPAGILAGSMVARTLWARKKATAEAPTE